MPNQPYSLEQLLSLANAKTKAPREQKVFVLTVDQMQRLLESSIPERKLKDSIEYVLPLELGDDPMFKAVVEDKQAGVNVVCRPISQKDVITKKLPMMYAKGVQIANLRIATDDMWVGDKKDSVAIGWRYNLVLFEPLD